MAYARFSDTSDVYVYADYRGFIECCACRLDDVNYPAGFADFHDVDSLIAHLETHRAAGHKVPWQLFDRSIYDASDFEPEDLTHK